CGNGFVLEEAKRRGFKLVRGVEPSTAAVAAAAPTIRPALVCDIMRPGLFAPATFDAVCMFQVFDHLPDPAGVLRECFRVLRPGGLLLCLNHNVASWSAKLLKEKSPIVDIEHTYLYSPETMRKIVEQAGFQARKCAGVWNRYSLHYVTRLVPLPGMLKRAALAVLRATRIGRVPCYVRLGNLYLVAQKPAA
ncbi:MAG TPA: class I SAM-dependent methyltransferase, partial [Pirellulales bacterium]|nr:class I SAM-dependent methyltransferase [Pirellulales bacterium]